MAILGQKQAFLGVFYGSYAGPTLYIMTIKTLFFMVSVLYGVLLEKLNK